MSKQNQEEDDDTKKQDQKEDDNAKKQDQKADSKLAWNAALLLILMAMAIAVLQFGSSVLRSGLTEWGVLAMESGTDRGPCVPAGTKPSPPEEKCKTPRHTAPCTPPAGGQLSHTEEMLFRLFESHLHHITLILAVVGGIVLAIEYFDFKRQKSLQSHVDSFMARSTNLIGGMGQMLEIANRGQTLASELQIRFEAREKEEQLQRDHLLQELTKFVAEHRQFEKHIPAVKRMAAAVARAWIRESVLPPAAFFVRGYYSRKIDSNSQSAIDDFSKVLQHPQADANLREQARLYRGIDYANQSQYDDALKDFEILTEEHKNNLLYEFYLADTQLLRARESDRPSSDPLYKTLADKLQGILGKLKTRGNYKTDPTTPADLKKRTSRSLASILLHELNNAAEAETVLSDSELNTDAPSLHLRLVALEKMNRPDDLRANAKLNLPLFRAAYHSTTEPRSKILRGMIVGRCLMWTGEVAELANLCNELLGIADTLQREQGGGTTAYSPFTQRNESVETIRAQINTLLKPAPTTT